MNNHGIQSLDRGMEILKLLGRKGRLTASAIALEIGIHQTSATRLLQSLRDAGLVYKPDYHSFSLDLGVLVFAGAAIQGFPIISAAGQVCTDMHQKHDAGFAAATLRDGRLLYLANVHNSAKISLVDDSDFPVHRSVLGLSLLHLHGPEILREGIIAGMKNSGEYEYNLGQIETMVNKSINGHGFLYLTDFDNLKVKAAMNFEFDCGTAALSVFGNRDISVDEAKTLLQKGIAEITASIKKRDKQNGKTSI